MSLPERLARRLRLPLIAAPMLGVSGPELVVAACKAGVVGAFPVINAGGVERLDEWLTSITQQLADLPVRAAPWCPNLVLRQPPAVLLRELDCIIRHCAELVITSVGSPAPVVKPLHDAGILVFADVATLHHARKAVEAGVDGLILLTAGAGGQTGWLNGFAFVRAVRSFFDGPIVLAGGVADGHALWAAQVLGCDLAYMGTKFIATHESLAAPAYRDMLVASTADDVMLTRAFTGLPTSMLRPSVAAAGMDPNELDEMVTPQSARERFGPTRAAEAPKPAGPRRWKDIWSAGHSVSGVIEVSSVAALVEKTAEEYGQAARASAEQAQHVHHRLSAARN